jgi:hypothetical protein
MWHGHSLCTWVNQNSPKNIILVPFCFTKYYYSISDFGVQLSLFLGGIFPRWDTSLFLFLFFFILFIFIFIFFIFFLLGAKILHGCQIFEIFGCASNDLFFLKMKSPKKFKLKKNYFKKIARFLYLVQLGNHK